MTFVPPNGLTVATRMAFTPRPPRETRTRSVVSPPCPVGDACRGVVVFGARGNVGRCVADGLLAAGEQVRAVSRTPAIGTAPGLEAVTADPDHLESLPAAFEGADQMFLDGMLNPQEPYDIEKVAEAAVAAGIRQVVLLSSVSVLDSDPELLVSRVNSSIEQAVQRSGMDWTFLGPGTFATNTRTWWAESIRTENVVRLPYPDAESAPVHEKDIANLAVTALTETGHSHQTYTIYGPESLTLRRQVEEIDEAIGRAVEIEHVAEEQARTEVGKTMPPFIAGAIVRQWAAADRVSALTSVIVDRITGAPARSYAQRAVDHADDFR